jgi:hypothetical protein
MTIKWTDLLGLATGIKQVGDAWSAISTPTDAGDRMDAAERRREQQRSGQASGSAETTGGFSDKDQKSIDNMAPFVSQAEQQMGEGGKALDRLGQGPLVDTAEARGKIQGQFSRLARVNLAQAAQRGLLHSRTLDDVRSEAVSQQAAANMQLRAQEEERRRSYLTKAEQSVDVAKSAREQMADGAWRTPQEGEVPEGQVLAYYTKDGKPVYQPDKETTYDNGVWGQKDRAQQQVWTPIYKDKREQFDAAIQEQQKTIAELERQRPNEAQLKQAFRAEIDKTTAQSIAAMQADAKRRGFSDDYISSLANSVREQAAELYAASDDFAVQLSGPDPAAAQAALSALYAPEKIETIMQSRSAPYGLLLGGAGAVVGGMVGGPSGAVGGYQVGGAFGGALEGLEG